LTTEYRKQKCVDTTGTVLVPEELIFFQIKYTEAFLSSISWKLLWFKITTMLTAVEKNISIVLFVVIFGTLSFAIPYSKEAID